MDVKCIYFLRPGTGTPPHLHGTPPIGWVNVRYRQIPSPDSPNGLSLQIAQPPLYPRFHGDDIDGCFWKGVTLRPIWGRV